MNEKHLRVWLANPEKIIKYNDWMEEVTNPIYFVRDGVPTSDGLFSNEIFGIDKSQRAERFAYIALGDWFITPHIYKLWTAMDSNIRAIAHGTKYFSIDANGYLVEDENGKTGINFLKTNIDKIKIKSTDSAKRDVRIAFIKKHKDTMFIKNMLVIPAYYRDVNTSDGYIGVGEVNKLYNSLIISAKALKETDDYGLPISNATKGRIQETLVQIYDWFTTGATSNSKESGAALRGKTGLIRRSVLSKTTDYSSRLVLSAPNLRVERMEDLPVDADHAGVPLASVAANLVPFIVFHIRRFFENEFTGAGLYSYVNKSGKLVQTKIKDPAIQFSDDVIITQINRYIHGFSNRFIPVEAITEDSKRISLRFKGRLSDIKNPDPMDSTLIDRRLTWCDLIYQAAVEHSKDKYALITRFPMDTRFNIYPFLINVTSTKETDQVLIDNTFYKSYPHITEELIGTNTSSLFSDTLNMCNLHLSHFGADYDGDQISVKIPYTDEAIAELKKYSESKASMIDLGSNINMSYSNECIQAMYNLTLTLSSNHLTKMDW